jgi:hypothetical protein
MHRELGTEVITWVALIAVAVAVVAWRPGRGPAWPIAVTVVSLAAVVAQLVFGFTGRLALHVPLGVTILVVNLGLVIALGGRRVAAQR